MGAFSDHNRRSARTILQNASEAKPGSLFPGSEHTKQTGCPMDPAPSRWRREDICGWSETTIATTQHKWSRCDIYTVFTAREHLQ